MYFNKRQKRTGRLFENQVKASLIDSDPYLWHISRYIHRNPEDLPQTDYKSYDYSSYQDFVSGSPRYHWLKPQRVLRMFQEEHWDYKKFVEAGLEQ